MHIAALANLTKTLRVNNAESIVASAQETQMAQQRPKWVRHDTPGEANRLELNEEADALGVKRDM